MNALSSKHDGRVIGLTFGGLFGGGCKIQSSMDDGAGIDWDMFLEEKQAKC